MASYGTTRATVRAALARLRGEGLIERRQGVGTYVVGDAVLTSLAEAHGTAEPAVESVFNRRMRPRELDRSLIALPAPAADRLGVPAGVPALRLEYVALLADEPVGIATNYVLFPQAELLRPLPLESDWYALLVEAGITVGESELLFGCLAADESTAALLGVAPHTPLVTMEQVIYDPSGRPFDLAHVHARGDRFRFVSRAPRHR